MPKEMDAGGVLTLSSGRGKDGMAGNVERKEKMVIAVIRGETASLRTL